MGATSIRKLHPPFPRFEPTSGLTKMLNRALGVWEGEHNLTDGQGAAGEVGREEGGGAHG